MPNEADRMAQLHLQGFHCAQILLLLGLEHQGKENPDLIRAMDGLSGGRGPEFSGEKLRRFDWGGLSAGLVCRPGKRR